MDVIDEDGNLFGYVNIVDALVVLVVLALVVGGTAVIFGDDSDTDTSDLGSSEASVVVDMIATDVQPYVANAVPSPGPIEGGTVDSIVNVSVHPAQMVTADQAGNLHLRDRPRLKDVTLRVELTATRQDGGLQYAGGRLRVGRELTLDLERVALTGEITHVSPS